MAKGQRAEAEVVERDFEYAIEDGMLIIRAPLAETPQPSSTGKSLMVASTGGFAPTGKNYQGGALKVSLNVIIPNPSAPARG